jgi:hypothetical protein
LNQGDLGGFENQQSEGIFGKRYKSFYFAINRLMVNGTRDPLAGNGFPEEQVRPRGCPI